MSPSPHRIRSDIRRRPLLFVICFMIAANAALADPRPLPAAKSTGVPRFDAAVDKAATWLRANADKLGVGHGTSVFVGYALLKTGDPIDSPLVAAAIGEAAARSAGSTYTPPDSYHHIYVAGVDAMLLADVDPDLYQKNLQTIASYIESVQRADGSWSDQPTFPGDVSMSQYGMLGLWAAQRAGAKVNPQKVDLAAGFLMNNSNPDGGWAYRPGTTAGPGQGQSTHNMTMAASGSIMLGRLMLHGSKTAPREKAPDALFGALEEIQDEDEKAAQAGKAWPDYSPSNGAGAMDAKAERGIGWHAQRFEPVQRTEHNMYFYYALERTATIAGIEQIAGRDWYTTYGDGILTLQAEDGSFATHSGNVVGTAFALLYFMRSTKQIIDKTYGKGLQHGKRGNPFGQKEKEREPTELDLLIDEIAKMDINVDETPIDVADEIVRSVTSIDDPEKLVGQKDQLKSLMKHPNADVRKAACWALGRTGDFALVPLMLDGIRDPNLDVNVEAVAALRYIARKPNGFGETLNPMEGLDKAPSEERLKAATEWRQKVLKQWSAWYFASRPFEEAGGLDELQVNVPLKSAKP
jgi:hypothetical protein